MSLPLKTSELPQDQPSFVRMPITIDSDGGTLDGCGLIGAGIWIPSGVTLTSEERFRLLFVNTNWQYPRATP